jgi:hypothetical protein
LSKHESKDFKNFQMEENTWQVAAQEFEERVSTAHIIWLLLFYLGIMHFLRNGVL